MKTITFSFNDSEGFDYTVSYPFTGKAKDGIKLANAFAQECFGEDDAPAQKVTQFVEAVSSQLNAGWHAHAVAWPYQGVISYRVS
tara:strand:+ start:99 stop:353 length:255 start_codon:yes stop_codon:yes gene_type:complete